MTTTNDRSRREYERRINAVMDHVSANLDGTLDLETLAGVACFSPFHFHRLFSALTGETLAACVKRLRLEAAANRLCFNRDESVLQVALACGFSSHAVLSREFRKRFGMTPTEWRDGNRKIDQTDRKGGQADASRKPHDSFVIDSPETRSDSMNVSVKDMPPVRVAYMRVTGRYGQMEQAAWERLGRWAGPRGLYRPDSLALGVCHDNPDVTDPDQCRYDACLSLPEDYEPDGEINTAVLPGGRYGVLRVEDGTTADFAPAWQAIFAEWLPSSGFQCDDRPSFERCYGEPDPVTGKLTFEIYVPVKPL